MLSNVFNLSFIQGGGSPRGVVAKALNCNIVVCEFELPSRYYISREKSEAPYPASYDFIVPLLFF